MPLTWEKIVTHALSLEGTEARTYFGKTTAKANGRALISPGREQGSFVPHIDSATKLMLMEAGFCQLLRHQFGEFRPSTPNVPPAERRGGNMLTHSRAAPERVS
jgi:hypothetical protein